MLLRRGVEAFLDYDLVGAPWSSDGMVGNGGLSLRPLGLYGIYFYIIIVYKRIYIYICMFIYYYTNVS